MDLQKRIAFIGSLTGATAVLLDLILKVTDLQMGVRLLLLLPLLVVLAMWGKDKFLRASRLRRPDLLPTSVDSEEKLIGRIQDVVDLADLCKRCPEVHLVGESGVGKSALLRAGLCPSLKRDGFLHPIYIDVWGEDWEQGPRSALTIALWSDISAEMRSQLEIETQPNYRTVMAHLRRFKAATGKIPLLVFDQFDDYLIRHRPRLLAHQFRTWLTAGELISKNQFWKDISRLLQQKSVHVLFITRTGEADGLHSVRFGPPQVYRLDRLESGFIRPLLARLTEEGVASNPERGWQMLQERLADDLSNEGWVLPVQMRLVLQGLTSLPTLTVSSYNRVGGVRGIEAALIERQLTAASRLSDISPKQLLDILLHMVDREKGKAIPLSLSTIEQIISSGSLSRTGKINKVGVQESLDYLIRREILCQRTDPESESALFALYHDYLCRGVLEAERRANRWLVFLRDQYRLFELANGNLWRQWRALLTPYAQCLLLVQRLRGKLTFGSTRQFALLSSIRFAPYILLPAILLSTADLGFDFPGAQPIRDLIDEQEYSLFRRYYSIAEIKSAGKEMRGVLVSAIRDRRAAGGWIRSTEQPTDERDFWSHSQSLCALLRAPEAQTIRPLLIQSAALLFDPSTRVDKDGIAYGWFPNDNSGYTRVEPIFWAGCAAALAAAASTDAAQSKGIADWNRYVDMAVKPYRPLESGGWNVFPHQVNRSEHSVYATALSLLMLLERHTAAKQTGAEIWSGREEELLARTIAWLNKRYDADAPLPGWRDGIDFPEISEGLTLQIYSLLLRAEEEAGIRIPSAILKNMQVHLERRLRFPPRDLTVKYKATFITHERRRMTDELPVTFLSYPWAIECTTRWLRRQRIQDRQAENPLVRRALAEMVIGQGKQFTQRATSELTFRTAELLYALNSIEDL